MASPNLHVIFQKQHFAEGRFRRAYQGFYQAPQSKYGQKAVVKKKKNSYMWEATDWSTSVEMNKEAQSLAEKFNRISSTTYPIEFTDVGVIRVIGISDPDSTFKVNEYGIVEDYIPGQYKKWCNNYGYISKEAKTSHIEMPAFMHWSWCYSHGEKMISDLQGVRNEDPQSYVLTDLAMLSISGSYGATDTGVEGMAMFFLHHECNHFCVGLPKPQMKDYIRVIPDRELSDSKKQLKDIGNATSYTHELKFPPRVRQGVATIFRRVASGY